MAEACQLHAIVSWQSRHRPRGLSGAAPVVAGVAGGPGGHGLGGGSVGYRGRGWGTQTRRTGPARPELGGGAPAAGRLRSTTQSQGGRGRAGAVSVRTALGCPLERHDRRPAAAAGTGADGMTGLFEGHPGQP